MLRRSPLFAWCLLIAPLIAAQQDIRHDQAHGVDPERLAHVQEAMKEADKHFAKGGHYFMEAVPRYETAYAVDPDNLELNMKLGLCHLNGRHHHLALPYFEKALALDPRTPRIHFLLGYALQLNAQWDKAIAEFQAHQQGTDGIPDPEAIYNTADKHITECRNGKSLESKPVRAQLENLGPRLNSELADYGVLFSNDGRTLYFTSRRPNTTGGKLNKATNEHFEDIYTSSFADSWSEPTPMPSPVNTNGNDATIGLCANGEKLLIYRDAEGVGDIWSSERQGDAWGIPKTLGPNVATKFHESSAWITNDGAWIYFVSDRPNEGLGGQDIYRARWDRDLNGWDVAENLGPAVNTIHDEDGVFVADDGTLYFSSRGHSTIGGYDVFRSTNKEGQWTKPENLGWPINSPEDDLFFVLMNDGRTGYFSSARAGGMGDDDLYRVNFLDGAPALENARKSMEEGTKEVLHGIFFEEGQATLQSTSLVEFDRLISILRENPALRIEIGGHCEGTGNVQELSQARAQAVVDHLAVNGIAPGRLVAKGYGATQPIAPGNGEAKGGRIEIKVLAH